MFRPDGKPGPLDTSPLTQRPWTGEGCGPLTPLSPDTLCLRVTPLPNASLYLPCIQDPATTLPLCVVGDQRTLRRQYGVMWRDLAPAQGPVVLNGGEEVLPAPGPLATTLYVVPRGFVGGGTGVVRSQALHLYFGFGAPYLPVYTHLQPTARRHKRLLSLVKL